MNFAKTLSLPLNRTQLIVTLQVNVWRQTNFRVRISSWSSSWIFKLDFELDVQVLTENIPIF